MKIRMANFVEAMNDCCVIDAEFPFSGFCVFMKHSFTYYEIIVKKTRKRKFTEVDETKSDPSEIIS